MNQKSIKLFTTILCLTIGVLLTSVTVVEARRGSPLLVEDDGSSRRNRPAGESTFVMILMLVSSQWYDLISLVTKRPHVSHIVAFFYKDLYFKGKT